MPVLRSRDVQQGLTWSVRLDSFQTTEQSAASYDHPVSWQAEELSAILSKLIIEARVGLMDSAKPAKPLFSQEEIDLLQPAVRQAFEKASPTEWIAFVLLQPHGDDTGVTSGGLFVESHRLHVVVANHGTMVGLQSEELARVRVNPFYSIKGSGGVVAIEPARFGLATKANWSGGHRASASELVLDHSALLAHLKHTDPRERSIRVSSPSGDHLQFDDQVLSDGASGQGALHDRTTVSRLQIEIERLKKQLAEKDVEIERLKAESLHSGPRP